MKPMPRDRAREIAKDLGLNRIQNFRRGRPTCLPNAVMERNVQKLYLLKELDYGSNIALGRHKGLPLSKFWNLLNSRSLMR
jgi:hypothetical protein